MGKVRYGVIGAGAISQRRHLPEIQADPHAVLAAVADANAQRAQQVASRFGGEAFSDYRRMLNEADLEAVVVAGPNALHGRMTLDALRAGRHVLCEKPMARTPVEARKMVHAARQSERHLMMAMNQRFMPQHVRAKEILESGRLGRVLSFRTAFAHQGPERWSVDGAQSWFFDRTKAVFGAMGDLGIHKIDLLRWLLNEEFAEVTASVQTLDKRHPDGAPIDLDDHACLLLRTTGGVIGTVWASWTHYGLQQNYTWISCERGVISIGLDPQDPLVVEHPNGDREGYRFTALNPGGWPSDSGIIRAFSHCILDHTHPPMDGEDGLRCLQVAAAAQRSSQAGRTVKLGA